MKPIIKITIVAFLAAAIVITMGIVFSSIYNDVIIDKYDSIHIDVVNAVKSSIKSELTNTGRTKEDYQKALEEVELEDDVFVDIIVLTLEGEVIVASNSIYSEAFITTLEENAQEAFLKKEGDIYDYSNDNENTYLVFNAYDEWDLERVVGVLHGKTYSYITAENTVFRILEFFIILITLSGAFVIVLHIMKRRNDQLYNVRTTGNFILTITEHGKILSADNKFKAMFDVKTLENALIDYKRVFSLQLKNGEPLVASLQDRQGNDVKLIFNAAASLGSYKLVGAIATDFVQDYLDYQYSSKINELTTFWNKEELEQRCDQAKNEGAKECIMCFFSINNYSYYTEIWGESFAKRMKKKYSNMLKETLDSYGDLYTIEEDIDILFISNNCQKELFMGNIESVFKSLNKALLVNGQSLLLDIRCGVIEINMTDDSFTLQSASLNGKIALKYAVQGESRAYYVLTASFVTPKQYDFRTREGILKLMQSGMIDVWYQPQMNVITGKITGVEALLRIIGDHAKQITVQDLVNSAERTGCMIELGEFIYNRAMDSALLFRKHHISVSINISPIQLMQIGFVDNFLKKHSEKLLLPNDVRIELVESVFIHSMRETALKIEMIRKQGIPVEIDDFGTGYSSFSYLRKMNVDTVKIDKLFVENIEKSKKDIIIVRNILSLLKELGIESVIEGVSNETQVGILKEMGCTVIQGFWLAKALPLASAIKFIQEVNKE